MGLGEHKVRPYEASVFVGAKFVFESRPFAGSLS